ncbi:MAG: ATP-binding cassette domain-containing protein [candidate division Zixibacteria bacterium]|nr:ATP-binding cassette domain-containing protein [candidate division Zixibacteria bacterium]
MTAQNPVCNGKECTLRARGVTKRFDSLVVVDDLDLDVMISEVVVMMGPSGSGKSTLLRCLNGLEWIDAGQIDVAGVRVNPDGEGIHELRTNVGLVFQQFNLFPHLTAIENVALAPRVVRQMDQGLALELARKHLEQVDLGNKLHRFPAELSGGQQQRVAMARALAMSPKLLLFDEPTSALDPQMIGEVLAVMKDLAQSGMTMIVVSHEVGFAREVADRVLFFDDGKILESGKPLEVLNNSTHPRARTFFDTVL